MAKENKKVEGFERLGFITFWRGYQDDPLWKENRKFSQFEAWLDMYAFMTSGIDRTFIFRKRVIKLKRGKFVTSQRMLARRWNWTRGSVRNFLRKLERRKSIYVEARKSPPCLIITFLKYNERNPKKEKNEK